MWPYRHGCQLRLTLRAPAGIAAALVGGLLALAAPQPTAHAAGTHTSPLTATAVRAASPSGVTTVSASSTTGPTGGAGVGPATLTGAQETSTTAPPPVSVTVRVGSTPTSDPLPAGFLGFSVEFPAIHQYLGRDPQNLNPIFSELVRGLDQGQPPILRIGGNSTDQTWLPLPGLLPPLGVDYALTPDWLTTLAAFTRATDSRLILGVNLGIDDPQIAAVEGRALLAAIGRQHVQELEIGNEPDLFTRSAWFYPAQGRPQYRRIAPYSLNAYEREFLDWRAALPTEATATGSLASLGWLGGTSSLASTTPGVSALSIHRYPLTHCPVKSDSPYYPSQANLFSSASTAGVAAPLAPFARVLHSSGIDLRVDELNSASCEGAPGLSDTFAAALWVIDALDNLAAANVDGINLHTLPGASYAPFSFVQSDGTWTGEVRPVYYGMLFFARAFPPGATLLAGSDSSADNGGDVKAFTTLAPDGSLRTTLINENPTTAANVTLTLPVASPLDAQSLTAPSLSATNGVMLGGSSFADPTRTGALAAPSTTRVNAGSDGSFTVTVPAASALLLSSAN